MFKLIFTPLVFVSTFLSAQVFQKIESINSNEIVIMEKAPSGKTWLGTAGSGCIMFDPITKESTLFDKSNSSLRSDSLTAIAFKDIGGVLHSFMATNNGVAYLHGGKWDTLANLPASRVTDIAIGPENAIIIATRDSGIAVYNNTLNLIKIVNKTTLPGLMTNRINALQRNDLFCPVMLCATDSGLINLSYDPDLNFTMGEVINTSSNIIQSNQVQVITAHPSCDTFVYIGTNQGLSLSRNINTADSLVKLSKATGLPSSDITVLEMDKNGTLWIGTRDAGVACYKGGNITKIDMTNGLLSNKVAAINCSSPNNDCWVASPDKGIMTVGLDFVVKQKINLGVNNGLTNEIEVASYPQPTYDFVYFRLPALLERGEVKIYNISGAIVKQMSINNTDRFEIDMRDVLPGMYAYMIEGNGNTVARGRVMIDK